MTTHEPEVSLENAEILMREGMLEDAKHYLFQLRIRDPESVVIREKLAELHAKELEVLLGREAEPRVPLMSSFATERILKSLEGDIGPSLVEEMARDEELQAKFSRALKNQTRNWDPRSHLDLGIGLLEMGLASAAIREFEKIRDGKFETAARCLRAQAEILRGHAFDAILILESLLQESELSTDARCEVLYLLGRAHDKLGDSERAKYWYLAVSELQPNYRDVADRLS